MTKDKYLSVNALTTYIAEKFVKDPYLERVFVQGELSNAKLHSSGHLYFSLKDENSQIRGIMFQSQVNKLKFRPKDGDKVIVRKQNIAHNGEIIVAMTADDEATVKRFYKEKGYYRLQPENSTMDPILVDSVTVLGKVVGLFREM